MESCKSLHERNLLKETAHESHGKQPVIKLPTAKGFVDDQTPELEISTGGRMVTLLLLGTRLIWTQWSLWVPFQHGIFHNNFFFRHENWRQVACSDLALHLCTSGRSSGWKSEGWLCVSACLCLLEIYGCSVLLPLLGDSAFHSTGPPAGNS